MNIQVVKVTNHDDGTCTVDIDLDEEALYQLAEIGFEYLLKKKAEEAISEHIKDEKAE